MAGPSSETIWELAFHRYKNGLNGSDLKRFERAFKDTSTYSDVLSIAETAATSSSHKFSGSLKVVLAPFVELAPVFDVVSQINGGVGCAVWGPLKLIIQASANYSGGLETILEVLETLTINMQQYKIVEKIHAHALVREVLQNFYLDFIDFCARCIKYQSRGKFVNGLRSGFKPFDTEAKDVIANIRRHASAIESTAAIVEMEKSDVFRKMTTTHISNQSKQELEDQQRKVRMWLKPANLDDEQRRRQKEHVKHTNAWFLAHPSFQNWLEGTTRLLWAIGKPGCGKSILASSIVAQLYNRGLQPLYFYFNSKLGTRLDAGPLGLVRSFLAQIMSVDSELVHTLHTLYQRSSSEEAGSFDILWEVFRDWCSSRKQPLYCVIDALDEGLEMSEAPDDFLTTLFITFKECEMAKMVVLSRPNHIIEGKMCQNLEATIDPVEPPSYSEDPDTKTADAADSAFHTLTAQILIEETQVRSDIDIYVKDRVKRTPKLKAWISEADIDDLCARAEGMFLWARFLLEELQTAISRNVLKAKLDKAPKSLKDMYDMIINRLQETLDEDQIRLCRKILKWVTTAKESLTVNQLTVAVAVRKNDKEIDEGELLFDPRHDIIAVCAPLVEILSDDTVRIIHLSVKEYLYDSSRDEEGCPFSLSPTSSNADIGSALLTLLSFNEFAAANSIDLLDGLALSNAKTKLEAQALLIYGLRNWPVHCIESGSSPKLHILCDQITQYVRSDCSYLWMESLAKHESGASWTDIENKLCDWCGPQFDYARSKNRLAPLIHYLSSRRWNFLSKQLGPNHPKTLTALANHAYVHGNMGNWFKAEKLQLEVLEGRRKALPESHPDILVAMANLAWTYWNRGHFNQAARLEIEVLQTREKLLGKDHVDTLTAMANLAGTYQKLGKRDEAEILESRVLEDRRRILGDNHPDTLTAMGYVAVSFRNREKLKEAEKLDTEVLESSRRRLGENHPETLRAMGRLVGTYQAQKRWADAEILGYKTLEGCRNVYRYTLDEHPDTLSAMASLALTYSNQSRFEEAESLQAQVLARHFYLDANHPDTLAATASLAAIRQNRMDAEVQTETLS